jgi:hypothetical protein
MNKRLSETINNPTGKRLLEAYFDIPASELIHVNWSEFRFVVAKKLDDNLGFIHILGMTILYFNDDNQTPLCNVTSRKQPCLKNIINVIWGFCHGVISIEHNGVSAELREYLLSSGIYTADTILRSSEYFSGRYFYDTFEELIIKGNPPRHATFVSAPLQATFVSVPLQAELVVSYRKNTYDVKELAEQLPKMKYLSIGTRSKIINPVDSVQILRHKHQHLPILVNHESQRNVKSARN